MASAAEAECGALFNNTKEGFALHNTLIEIGHPQPPTPVQVNNSTAYGFANKQIKQKRSKSMDMRFLLGPRPSQPETISRVLATRTNQSGRLQHKTSSSCSSSTSTINICVYSKQRNIRFCECVLILAVIGAQLTHHMCATAPSPARHSS